MMRLVLARLLLASAILYSDMKYICSHISSRPYLLLGLLLFSLSYLLTACNSAFVAPKPSNQVQTVSVDSTFQRGSPSAATPGYLCGAWSSNNAPSMQGTITIYARLTRDVVGIPGAPATAIIHFHNGDVTLTSHPTSDAGGFVNFTFSLLGRQPAGIPATVDVAFTLDQDTLDCTSAFFTPG